MAQPECWLSAQPYPSSTVSLLLHTAPITSQQLSSNLNAFLKVQSVSTLIKPDHLIEDWPCPQSQVWCLEYGKQEQ